MEHRFFFVKTKAKARAAAAAAEMQSGGKRIHETNQGSVRRVLAGWRIPLGGWHVGAQQQIILNVLVQVHHDGCDPLMDTSVWLVIICLGGIKV